MGVEGNYRIDLEVDRTINGSSLTGRYSVDNGDQLGRYLHPTGVSSQS